MSALRTDDDYPFITAARHGLAMALGLTWRCADTNRVTGASGLLHVTMFISWGSAMGERARSDRHHVSPVRIQWRERKKGSVDQHGAPDGERNSVGPRVLTRQIAASLTPERLEPVRELHGYQGMRNRPGLAWSQGTRQLLQCESGLEMFAIRQLDFEGEVVAAIAQPFILQLSVGGPDGDRRPRHHVPDFFVRLSDGTLTVIDVHRVLRDVGAKSRDVLDATALACHGVGWAYRVITEPTPVARRNMQLIFGHRMPPLFVEEVLDGAKSELTNGPVTWGHLVAVTSKSTRHPRALVIPCLFHGLWRQDLRVDLTCSLSNDTIVAMTEML